MMFRQIGKWRLRTWIKRNSWLCGMSRTDRSKDCILIVEHILRHHQKASRRGRKPALGWSWHDTTVHHVHRRSKGRRHVLTGERHRRSRLGVVDAVSGSHSQIGWLVGVGHGHTLWASPSLGSDRASSFAVSRTRRESTLIRLHVGKDPVKEGYDVEGRKK